MSVTSRRVLVVLLLVSALLLAAAAVSAKPNPQAGGLSPVEELGKALYFDESLSSSNNQSCAACHAPEWGFTGPVSAINAHGAVYPGSLPNRFGNRKPPSAAYAGESPVLYYDGAEGLWIGGMFWDGRATGWVLGDPVAEQAKGPFLNPLEQALANAQVLCGIVQKAEYAYLFEEAWGEPVSCVSSAAVAQTYDRIGMSISAFEHSSEVNPFSSKFDAWVRAGEPKASNKNKAVLTEQELWGLELFEGKAMCSACHISEFGPDGEPRGPENLPVFTDFTYDNLGVPKNPENPFYWMPSAYNPDGEEWVDYGLGAFLMSIGDPEGNAAENMGKQKVPTLRNVGKRPLETDVKAYAHNGYFKSLEEIVHFYNTRDVDGAGWNGMPWPDAEVGVNVNADELGDLGLTATEEAALVAFMRTLSDGYGE